MQNIKEKLKCLWNKFYGFMNRHEYFKVWILLYVIGFLTFASKSIINGVTLPMNGDYTLQQLPFYTNGYDLLWNFIKTGEFPLWSYENFLGVNYFGANTFYYLTSPFFLIVLFFPRVLIPQAIYLTMVLKISVGGLLMYILFKNYIKISKEASFIGAVAYTLCGWGMFYLWFNHFSDVMAVLPLTFIGIEHVLQKKKGWLLTFWK